MGVGVAVAFGVVQVFVLPRALDVGSYGEYRLFLVYAAYMGILHFGLADGAFVRWAGRDPALIRAEAPRVAGWLIGVEGGVLAVAVTGATLTHQPLTRVYLVAFAAGAFCINATTFTGYVLQAAGDFVGAGQLAALAPGVFALLALLAPLRSLAVVLAAYVGSFGLAALVGARRIARFKRVEVLQASVDDPPRPSELVRVGLPVLGANLAAGLAWSLDRILVGAMVPVERFALYGFATTVMVMATAVTQVLTRVSLSHAGRHDPSTRAGFLEEFYGVIALGFGVALAGLPLFEYVVARSLPAYAAALPIVRAIVVAAPFWMAVHVVLVGTLQSYGKVRRQFQLELGGALLVAAACASALARAWPLWAVAASGAAAAAVTWGCGVAFLGRHVPETRLSPAVRFVATLSAQGLALTVAFVFVHGWVAQSAAYMALAAAPTLLAARGPSTRTRLGQVETSVA